MFIKNYFCGKSSRSKTKIEKKAFGQSSGLIGQREQSWVDQTTRDCNVELLFTWKMWAFLAYTYSFKWQFCWYCIEYKKIERIFFISSIVYLNMIYFKNILKNIEDRDNGFTESKFFDIKNIDISKLQEEKIKFLSYQSFHSCMSLNNKL